MNIAVLPQGLLSKIVVTNLHIHHYPLKSNIYIYDLYTLEIISDVSFSMSGQKP